MIIITGAAGFIGSVVAGFFNQQGQDDLILVDDFSKEIKKRIAHLKAQNPANFEKIDEMLGKIDKAHAEGGNSL